VRRSRITLRCLTEDFAQPLPAADEELSLDHPLVEAFKNAAQAAPLGLKRIVSIAKPPVFRIKHGRYRGASWVDEDAAIFWLLAFEERKEGSRADAYEHFLRLYRDGRLLPTDDDRARDRLETATRFLRAIREQVPRLLAQGREHQFADVEMNLGGTITTRLHVRVLDELEEIWVAVALRDADGIVVSPRIRDVIVVTLEQVAGRGTWDVTASSPEGDLDWFEVARYGLVAL
jgi:hypothetical protein